MNFSKSYTNNNVEIIHVFEKNRQLCDEPFSEQTRDASPINWDNLESIASSERDNKKSISYDQALHYFQSVDLSGYNEKISMRVKKSGTISSCFPNLEKCKLKQEYINDYNLLFLIAKCPYEKHNKTHEGMLMTVYDSLIPNQKLDFSWENIGFQSNLPWTDLRGVGMLGVLELLYFTTSYSLLRNILYELSINELNSFPFAVVGLNITSIILNVLRRDKVNRNINKEGVFLFTNKLYAAIFHHFGQIWTNEAKTILDIGSILKDIEKSSLSKRTREKILKNLDKESMIWKINERG